MIAQKRLDDLEAEIVGIEAEIVQQTAEHAAHVEAGRDEKAEQAYEQIRDARKRLEAAQMRRDPLGRAVKAEQAKVQAKIAEELTVTADARLDALEATLAQALEAAKALAVVTDQLDRNAALHWANEARKAVDAGGTPARRHLAGLDELHKLTDNAVRKLRHVSQDYAQRSVNIPVPSRSYAKAAG